MEKRIMNSKIHHLLMEHYGIDNAEYLEERVPFRNGKTSFEYGKLAFNGLNQECFVLNDLKIFTFKPNFMIIAPKLKSLVNKGDGTNGVMLIRSKADDTEYKSLGKGTCYAKTYFYGRPKQGRTLDWLQRISEKGFSISDITGVYIFKGAAFDITYRKRDKYTVTSNGYYQKNEIIPVRIVRTK